MSGFGGPDPRSTLKHTGNLNNNKCITTKVNVVNSKITPHGGKNPNDQNTKCERTAQFKTDYKADYG